MNYLRCSPRANTQADSAFPLNFGDGLPGTGRNETDAWNYFQINSLDKDGEGNYLLSARNVAALFKINGSTGEIIWQLGGLNGGSEFALAEEDGFAFQHHARFRSRSEDGTIEVISLFDNGAHSAPVRTHDVSRALIVELNHTDGTARALGTFDAPDGLSARTQGSVQILPNENVFVNWGEAGAITEFTPDGEVIFHSYLDSEPYGHLVQSYRGFRYNWTGSPAEEPALAAFERGPGGLDVYVSWNGDTETRTWRFYGILEGGRRVFLGETERKGFETHGKLSGRGVSNVEAEAIGHGGEVLQRSRRVPVSESVERPDIRLTLDSALEREQEL